MQVQEESFPTIRVTRLGAFETRCSEHQQLRQDSGLDGRRGAGVLVVDDEPGVVQFAVEVLRDAGYAVASARGGDEALRRVTQSRGQGADAFEDRASLERVKAIFDELDEPFLMRIEAASEPESIAGEIVKRIDALLAERA